MVQTYSFVDYKKESMARAIGKSLPISFKQSVEICSFIRNKEVSYAKNVLGNVADLKQAIPFRRYKKNIGHKTKMGPGRYPIKASLEILSLINAVEANAQFKGLNTSNLIIRSIVPNKASTVQRSGRKRGRKSKRTHIEIVVEERAQQKDEKKKSKYEIKK